MALLGSVVWLAPAERVAASPTRLVFGQLQGPQEPITTEWQLPAGEPRAWVLLQHGFGRQCANLRGTARRLAEQGVATVCLQADMAGGAPGLAQALAVALSPEGAPGLQAPGGLFASGPWVLAGHSAGACFASRVAESLVQRARHRLAGLVLLDPVGDDSLPGVLKSLATDAKVPVQAWLAPPSRCNAGQPALAQGVDAAFMDVERPVAARHLDAEGEDTEALAVWLCGEGRPEPAHTEALRRWLLGRVLAPQVQGTGAAETRP